MTAVLAGLFIHPVKSAAGIACDSAVLGPRGLQHDREWMIVDATGRFVTQREEARLALLKVAIEGGALQLSNPQGAGPRLALDHEGAACEVTVWRSQTGDSQRLVKLWATGAIGDVAKEGARILAFLERAKELSEAPIAGVPGVIGIHWTEDAIVLVSEFVEGTPLSELLSQEPAFPSVEDALAFLVRLVELVDAIHERTIAHGDLKPDNIMLQLLDNGEIRVKVIDFGIATLLSSGLSSRHTQAAGSFPYMAPEQLHGTAGPAADLFSFGIVAWKMATEALYPMSGTPIWEFVERAGSYAAPLVLALILIDAKTTVLTLRRSSQ